MPDLRTLVDERASGSSISNEAHVVGEDTADRVFLDEVPDPAQAITISGYTKVSGSPAAGEFQLENDYSNALVFNAADAGDEIQVSYTGLGSKLRARDMNRMHSKLLGIQVLTDGATITWDCRGAWTAYVELGGDRALEVLNAPEGAPLVLMVAQPSSGGPWDITSYAGGSGMPVDFGAGGAPTLTTDASEFDILGFIVYDGTLRFTGIRDGFAV